MKKNRNYFLNFLLRFVIFVTIGMGIIYTAGVFPGGVVGNGTGAQLTVSPKPIAFCQKYPYANDRMVYIAQEDGTIEQWSTDGNYQQKLTLPIMQESYDEYSAGQLLWVDNKEIIWYAYGEETEDEETYAVQHVYAAPIEENGSGEEPNFEKAKELFVCPDNLREINGVDPEIPSLTGLGSVYADDRYLIYRSGEDILFLYDQVEGGQPIAIPSSDEYTILPQYAGLSSLVTGDQILYHTGMEPGKLNEDLYGFWCYNLVSKERQSIDDRCPSKAAYVADQTRDKVYYQIIKDQSIWEWDCQNGERRELISEEQFQSCYEENGLVWDDAYYDDSMFVEGNRLYFIKNQKYPQIFSYLFAESTLYYEEKLSLMVQNSEYFHLQKEEHADYLGIAGGKLLLRYDMEEEDGDEEGYYICIDLKTAEEKAVGKEDREKIYFGMLGLWLDPGTTGSWEATNELAENNDRSNASSKSQYEQTKAVNKTDSTLQPGSESQNPLSIENQLACISAHIEDLIQEDEWYDDDYYHHYAVTDLDHNGKLEFIDTSGEQGSGRFTYTDYYQVAADGQSLRRIMDAAVEIDIMDGYGIDTAYVDPDTGAYYYLAGNYASGGAGARYFWRGAVILDNGMLTARTIADGGLKWNKKRDKEVWYGYSYLDGKEQKLKEKEFQPDQLEGQFFGGMKKVPAKISWFQCKGKKRNQTREKIMEKARRSYQKFAPR